jgi:hypothetical protein
LHLEQKQHLTVPDHLNAYNAVGPFDLNWSTILDNLIFLSDYQNLHIFEIPNYKKIRLGLIFSLLRDKLRIDPLLLLFWAKTSLIQWLSQQYIHLKKRNIKPTNFCL